MVSYFPATRLSLNEVFASEWVQGPVPSQDQVVDYMETLKAHIELER